jgi:hypothetical protein
MPGLLRLAEQAHRAGYGELQTHDRLLALPENDRPSRAGKKLGSLESDHPGLVTGVGHACRPARTRQIGRAQRDPRARTRSGIAEGEDLDRVLRPITGRMISSWESTSPAASRILARAVTLIRLWALKGRAHRGSHATIALPLTCPEIHSAAVRAAAAASPLRPLQAGAAVTAEAQTAEAEQEMLPRWGGRGRALGQGSGRVEGRHACRAAEQARRDLAEAVALARSDAEAARLGSGEQAAEAAGIAERARAERDQASTQAVALVQAADAELARPAG